MSQNGEVQMITEQIAKSALDRVRQEGLEKGWPVVEGLILHLYQRLDRLHYAMSLLANEHKVIKNAILGEGAAMAPPSDGGGYDTAVAGEASRVRLGADGTPISAEQAAAEDAMDAAAGPRGGGPVSAPVQNGGKSVRMQAPITETRIGADGTPLSPEQEAIERQMDEAAGPRP